VKSFAWGALLLAGTASPAFAGPPYLTDDPEPTDTGHWEIYAFGAAEGRHSTVDADAGFDLNYGAIEGVQLTATLPLSFSHAPLDSWRKGSGDVELGVKYRFLNDKAHGFSAAIFPRAILPTASHSPGEGTHFLLPLWMQLDFAGGTSLFGGGGYTIGTGAGSHDYWQFGAALTHDVSDKVSLGAEITRQGADTLDGTTQTRAGIGAIIGLSDHYALLFSGGPTRAEHRTGYHAYAALGMNF
jgi:hypothetical protein